MSCPRNAQQPDDDESVFALVPTVEKVDEFVIVEPGHGVVVLLDVIGVMVGVESGTIGLRPVVPVSVAPSGIVPPIREAELVPDVEADGDVPLADDDAQPAVVFIPPPSNVEGVIIDAVPLGPEDCAEVEPLVLQVELTAGLKPPGLISVDPSGMLEFVAPFVPPEPSVPSGEVVPIAGEVTEVCALTAAQPQNRASAANNNGRRIGISRTILRACIHESLLAPGLIENERFTHVASRRSCCSPPVEHTRPAF
jgi:hypothetical protein